jgi:SAM-dependent methyltransferase
MLSLAKKIVSKLYAQINGFQGSKDYWEERYQKGGTSGAGSYGKLAAYKAAIINDFVIEHNIQSVLELGCGDGNQLLLAKYPSYIGYDVSSTAIELCKQLHDSDRTKAFYCYDKDTKLPVAELTLSLDVIYHLLEDRVFNGYMEDLFKAASKYVIIYSSNKKGNQSNHERMRDFTNWIVANQPSFKLIQEIPNPYPYNPADEEGTSQSDFFIYERL